jgi:hypothetical protein
MSRPSREPGVPHALNTVHANTGELACATGGSPRQQDNGRVLYDSCVFWASWNAGTATRTWSASETGVGESVGSAAKVASGAVPLDAGVEIRKPVASYRRWRSLRQSSLERGGLVQIIVVSFDHTLTLVAAGFVGRAGWRCGGRSSAWDPAERAAAAGAARQCQDSRWHHGAAGWLEQHS